MKVLLIGLMLFVAVFMGGCAVSERERDGAVKAIQTLPNYQKLVLYFSLDDNNIPILPVGPVGHVKIYNLFPPETIRNAHIYARHAAIFRGKDNTLWLMMLSKNYEVSFLKKLA